MLIQFVRIKSRAVKTVLVVVVICLYHTLAFGQEEIRSITQDYKGEVMHQIDFQTIDGKTIRTASLRGKVIMINFWSLTCGPCIKEIPELNRLVANYGHNNEVVFIAPLPESAEEVRKFLKTHPFEFLIVPNSEALFKKFGINQYPVNFFVDKKGLISDVHEGTPIQKDLDTNQWRIAVFEKYSGVLDKMVK